MKKSDRKNLDWQALADEFYNMVKDTTSESAVEVVVSGLEGVLNGIDVYPADTNTTGCFYHMEEMVDFARCKGLSCYVGVEDNKTFARIF